MATEQTPLEYYHHYRASQRRVQQWVQKTSRELEAGSGGSSDLRRKDVDNEDAGSGLRRGGSGRRRSPPPSKRQIHDQVDSSGSRGPSSRSRSTRKKARTDNVRARSRKHYYSSDGMAISSLLPFGLVPLIFALTPPSVATLFAATILLAGYFVVDYNKKESISEKL